MKIIRYIVLEMLLLVAMLLCATAVMKVFDVLLSLDYENIWSAGFKAGFIAWLGLSVAGGIRAVKKRKYF